MTTRPRATGWWVRLHHSKGLVFQVLPEGKVGILSYAIQDGTGKIFSLPGAPANTFKKFNKGSQWKYISQMVWRHYSLFGLCHSTWLLYFSSMLKIETFSPIFPLTDSIIEASYWLFLWNFKKESINRFLWHSLYFLKFQIKPSPCYGMWLFHLHNMAKKQLFPSIFPLADSAAEVFYRLSLWNFKKYSIKHFLMIRPKNGAP